MYSAASPVLFLLLFISTAGNSLLAAASELGPGGPSLYVVSVDPSTSSAFISIDDSIYAAAFWHETTFTKNGPIDGLGFATTSKQITAGEFLNDVRQHDKDGIFVIVHGFNTSLERAILLARDAAARLHRRGAVILYRWPSADSLFNFNRDKFIAFASGSGLAILLNQLSLSSAPAPVIDVLGFSLGSQVVLDAFTSDVPATLHDVILIASAVELHQHDRALAGLCDALEKGRSILLYLRDFRDEETDELYFDFENRLISIIGESMTLIAIANPTADPTLKISPIPRLLVPAARWREFVDGLVERSTRIVVAAGRVRSGLDYEIDRIRQRKAGEKTIFVNMSLDAEEAPVPNFTEFPWKVSARDFGRGIFGSDIFKWLGEHVFLTFCREETTPRPKMRYQSRSLRFWWARLSLLGARSLIPKTKLAFYRSWLGAFDEFNPLEQVRLEVLAEEKRAAERNQVVLPFRPIFKVDEGSNPAVEAWNRRLTLLQRMETAVFTMSRRSAWVPIRKALRWTC